MRAKVRKIQANKQTNKIWHSRAAMSINQKLTFYQTTDTSNFKLEGVRMFLRRFS